MVVELKILIHLHDNDRIIQREKTTCSLDKFAHTFSEYKQHVNRFVGISDVAKELNFPHYDTTFAKVVKKPQSTLETFRIQTNDQYVSTKDSFTNDILANPTDLRGSLPNFKVFYRLPILDVFLPILKKKEKCKNNYS